MVHQIFDGHQVGQALHDFFPSLIARAPALFAFDLQFFSSIDKIIGDEIQIFGFHLIDPPRKKVNL